MFELGITIGIAIIIGAINDLASSENYNSNKKTHENTGRSK